jgi:Family of unknown function (DUF6049)
MVAFVGLGSSISSAATPVSRGLQTATGPALTLAAQSPWIEPTGPWFHLTVNLGDTQVPASELRVTATFYSRIEAASELQQATSGLPDETPLQRSIPVTVDTANRTASICVTVLPNPSVTPPAPPAGAAAAEACPSGSSTVYLDCTPGNGSCGQVHPVSVALQRTGSDGDVSRFTTFLTYQEPTVEGTGPLDVATVMPVGQASGAGTATATSTIAQLAAYHGVAMTLAVSPTTATALKGRGGKGKALQQLTELTEPGGDQLLVQPYVPIDVAALDRAGLTDEIGAQLDRGDQLLRQAGLHPTSGTWVDTTASSADADAGNLAAGLKAARVTHLVVNDTVLSASGNEEYTAAQPFSLDLGHGAHVSAVATVGTIDGRFTADPGDPVLAANQLLADLMFVHFENVFLQQLRGLALTPPTGWQPPAAFTQAFLGGLTGNPGLQPVTLSQLFARVPVGGNNEPAQRHLQSGDSSQQGLITRTTALRISTDRLHLGSFVAAVVGRQHHISTPASLVALSDALLATENATFTNAQRTASVESFQQKFNQVLGTISLAPERTITFTSRTASIPITVLHTASYPVTVVLTLDSDKFTFPSGNSRTVTLNRPTTPVRVQARARSSGDGLPVDVSLRTPDGQLVIAHTTVAVHSTSISIVGIGLTALAGLVLLVWWGRTWRRSRRQRPRAHAR